MFWCKTVFSEKFRENERNLTIGHDGWGTGGLVVVGNATLVRKVKPK